MNIDPFPLFLELVTFDQSIRELYTTYQRRQAQYNDALTSVESLNADLAHYKRAVVDAQKSVDELELTMKELNEKENVKKSQLAAASHSKEITGLKREIEHLKQEQHNQEEELIARWNRLENTLKEFDQQKITLNAQLAQLQQHCDTLAQELENITLAIAEKEGSRESKLVNVPQELLENYNTMRLRINNPVVPVTHDACSVCFQHITRQALNDLDRKRLMQCGGCFRLLYKPS